ncbi:beta-ketoacyl synthase N-terminal-like domain-containing protein [Streptomyces sp. NBS 14/10]|uniref:beta-ketoacyl synthase N-terminal-like domain-containing protein n=1 Tax=Streptomyces sp. NBS 14/10 TaxID=1945643 RepID=UPI000B7F6F80|nr:beta-ketoacyl synthase N-terminal-like domain-containing protein [Streptomyces sp. NBS 14/10]KAK1179537.1 beta-ketoacyl synthase N-terminal-like domain-containing protein [Streptomyces sp. NBS 14/10]
MVFATATSGPVISAWAAISPLGLHGADFATGLRSGRRAGKPLDPEEWSVPFHEACLVPDFHIKQILGRKGTRSMDRATGLAVTAIGRLLTDERPERLAGVGEDTGVALGTSTGSAQSIMDFTRDSLVGERPFFVDPARFPNTVMNCAAGQTAIWHGFKGPNTTIAGGRATGLLTLQYALRLQRAGRAAAVLCGAVEEFSSARAWLEWHSRADGDTAAVLGEGAAVWLLEPDAAAREHGRVGLVEVAGLEFGFAAAPEGGAGRARTVLADVVRRLLDRTGVEPGGLWAVADSQAPGAEGEAERAALAEVLDGHEPLRISAVDSIGDTYAASAAFQITAVLALAERSDTAPGSLALVTSVDRDGVVGAALLRTRPQATT